MKKPKKEDYGYIENNNFDGDKSGWAYEGGEDKFDEDLIIVLMDIVNGLTYKMIIFIN